MLSKMNVRHNVFVIIGVSFAFAFLLLAWVIFSPKTIGNDFQIYHIAYPLIFRIYDQIGDLSYGWYPFVEGGVSLYGFSMGQNYYPLNWLLNLFGFYESDFILELTTLKYIAQIALMFAYTTYVVTKKGRVSNIYIGLIFSISILANLKTLDWIRYGTSMETYFFSFVTCLYIVDKILLAEGKVKLNHSLLIALFVCTLSSGYHTITFFFGFSLLMLSIFYSSFKIVFRMTIIPFLISLMITASNWIPLASSMIGSDNIRTSGGGIAWASLYELGYDRARPFLGMMVTPWSFETHSATSGNFLFSMIVISLCLTIIINIRRYWKEAILIVWPIYYSFGTKSLLYIFLYNYVPGFDLFRIPGRVLTLIPFFIVFIILFNKIDVCKLIKGKWSYLLFFLLNAIGMVYILIANDVSFSQFNAATINPDFWTKNIKIGWVFSNMAGAGALFMYSREKVKRLSGLVVVFIVSMQTLVLFRYGTWVEVKNREITFNKLKNADHLPLSNNKPLLFINRIDDNAYGGATSKFRSFVEVSRGMGSLVLPIDEENRDYKTLLPFYKTAYNVCPKADPGKSDGLIKVKGESVCINPRLNLSLENKQNELKIINLSEYIFKGNFYNDGLIITPFPSVRGWSIESPNGSIETKECNGGILCFWSKKGVQEYRISYKASNNPKMLLTLSLLGIVGAATFSLFMRRRIWAIGYLIILAICIVNFFLITPRDLSLGTSYKEKLGKQLILWKEREL